MALLKYEYDCCELSGEMSPLHLHHVVFRGQGGDDLRANIVCLHHSLHTLYHAGDEKVRRRLAEYIRTHRPDTMRYLSAKLGEGPRGLWLDRHGIPPEYIL